MLKSCNNQWARMMLIVGLNMHRTKGKVVCVRIMLSQWSNYVLLLSQHLNADKTVADFNKNACLNVPILSCSF